MSGDDGKLFCCENEKVSIEIGAEAHALTINSTKKPITSGSFKVVPIGVQSSSLWIKPIFGSCFLKLDRLWVSNQLQSQIVAESQL